MNNMNTKQSNSDDFYERNYDELDFGKIFSNINRNRSLVFASSFIGLIFSVVYVVTKEPVWEGRFEIVLEPAKQKRGQGSGIGDISSSPILSLTGMGPNASKQSLKTEVKKLQSQSVLKPVYDFVKTNKSNKGLDVSKMRYKNWFDSNVKVVLVKGTTILSIRYRDTDKILISSVLNKLSETYQTYSGRDRERSLTQGIKYLENQFDIMKIKSKKSLEKLQVFSLRHGLGNNDGLPLPQAISKAELFGPQPADLGTFLYNREDKETKNRYTPHFKLLTTLEADLLVKSANYKPDSHVIVNLKKKIKSLEDSLTRPREILIKYRELRKGALRDEYAMDTIESRLASLKFNKARQTNPWEIITTPTILEAPAAPRRTRSLFFGLVSGLFLGTSLSLLKEKYTGIIYELDDFKALLTHPLLFTFHSNSKKHWEDRLKLLTKSQSLVSGKGRIVLINLLEKNSDKLNNLFNTLDLSNVDKPIIISNDISSLEPSDKLIYILQTGDIKATKLAALKQELSLLESEVMGWIYIDCFQN